MFKALKIVLLAVAGAVTYGILHDLVTAHVCVEYFTIGHPPVFNTESPTLLALGWGVIATWWAGVLVGVPIAVAARLGGGVKVSARQLVRPMLLLFSIAGVCALVSGIGGYVAAQRGLIGLTEFLAIKIPPEREALFLADAAAHSASYTVGFVGGMIVCLGVVIYRMRKSPPAFALHSNRMSSR